MPEHLVAAMTAVHLVGRWKDRFNLLGSMLALVRNHFGMRRQIADFYRRLEHALGDGRPDLEPLRPDELAPITAIWS